MTTAEMLIEEGKIEGKIEGNIEGKIEGKIEEKVEIALKMIDRSMDDEAIMDFTELTEHQIVTLRRDGKLPDHK